MGFFSSIGKFVGKIAAPLIGGGVSALGAARQASQASQMTDRQMAFQERMSNTAYQRAMRDMYAAGLNPILAYKQGGATSPGGASFMPPNIGAAGVTGAVAGANSAMAYRRLQAEVKNIEEDTTLKKSNWQARDIEAHKTLIDQKIAKEVLEQQRAATASAKHAERFWKTETGELMRKIDLIGKSLNPFASSARSIRGTLGR